MSGERWSGARGHDIPRREARLIGVSRGVRHYSALLKRTKPPAAQSMHSVRHDFQCLSARNCRTLIMAAVLSGFFAGTARADGLIIPFIGVNFGGDSGAEFGDAADASRFNWGASFAWMGAGVFGFEGDFGYSPDFFGKNDLGGSSVFTATGNLLLGIPFGGQKGFGIRPYGLAGIGLMHPDGRGVRHPVRGREQGVVGLWWRCAAVLRVARRHPRRYSLLPDVRFPGGPRRPARRGARGPRLHAGLAGVRVQILTRAHSARPETSGAAGALTRIRVCSKRRA